MVLPKRVAAIMTDAQLQQLFDHMSRESGFIGFGIIFAAIVISGAIWFRK